MNQETPTPKETSNSDDIITHEQAMAMPRSARRKLGKANKAKIWGSSTAHLKEKEKPFALTTFTGIRK